MPEGTQEIPAEVEGGVAGGGEDFEGLERTGGGADEWEAVDGSAVAWGVGADGGRRR